MQTFTFKFLGISKNIAIVLAIIVMALNYEIFIKIIQGRDLSKVKTETLFNDSLSYSFPLYYFAIIAYLC